MSVKIQFETMAKANKGRGNKKEEGEHIPNLQNILQGASVVHSPSDVGSFSNFSQGHFKK